MYERIASLPLEITGHDLEPLVMATPSGWARHTTVVHLRGKGCDGVGEDVTYEESDQKALQAGGGDLALAGSFTLAGFSARLDALPLFREAPARTGNWLYRRWAFESAALDLALQQADTTLAEVLELTPQPLSFVVSLSHSRLPVVRELYPSLRFKVDLAADWNEQIVDELAATGVVSTVDLKGHYRGSFAGPPANTEQYLLVAEHLPDAYIEDPWFAGPAWEVLRPYHDRITWDAFLYSLADIVRLPFQPCCVNIKPSRFGFLSELFRVYEYCAQKGIGMYGGGQFELGPGRGQIQYLASLFHADGCNDVAPVGFNEAELACDLPASPLDPAIAPTGFQWVS